MPYRDVMRVVAQDHDWFVLEVEPGVGRVFDLRCRRLFAPMSLAAILARGPWHEFDGDPEFVYDALTGAEDVASDQLSLTRQGCGEEDLMHPGGAPAAVSAAERRRATNEGYAPQERQTLSHAWSSRVAGVLKGVGAAVGDRLRSHSPTSH